MNKIIFAKNRKAGFSIARGASEDLFTLHQSARNTDAQAEKNPSAIAGAQLRGATDRDPSWMLQRSTPSNQLENENDQRNEKQDVNVSSENMEPNESKQPEDQQNQKDSPKHKNLRVEIVAQRSFGHAHPRVTKV